MNQMALCFDAPKQSYFQTTRLTVDELDAAIEAAEQQDIAVLAIFRAHVSLSPSRCWEIYSRRRQAPLTSIRRSITVLTGAGALTKTDNQAPGLYGKAEHVWRLAA